jgi:hypothetical protein
MLSEVLLVTLLAMSAPAVPDAGGATAPDTDTASELVPRSGPVCSADSRRERRAAAAREVRLHREALKVTRETLTHAKQILYGRSDGVVERWQAQFRERARARLDSTRQRDRSMSRLPTPALCAALAGRDGRACRALEDHDERGPCQVWTAVFEPEGEERKCDALPEPAKTICVLAETGDAKTCERATKAHRGICESAARALTGGDDGCSEPFHAQRCTWALLVSALGTPAQPCQSGAVKSEGLKRAMSFCGAAVQGSATDCPRDERPEWATDDGTKSLQREEAFRVEEGPEGPMAWVALMTSGPAVCTVGITTEDESAPKTSWAAAILSTLDDTLIGVGPLDESDAPRTLKTLCTPTFDWRTSSGP